MPALPNAFNHIHENWGMQGQTGAPDAYATIDMASTTKMKRLPSYFHALFKINIK